MTKVYSFTGSPSAYIPIQNYVPPLRLWHAAAGDCPGLPAEEVAKVRASHSQGSCHECAVSSSPWLKAGVKLPAHTRLLAPPWSGQISSGGSTPLDLHLSHWRFDEPSKKFPPKGFWRTLLLKYRRLSLSVERYTHSCSTTKESHAENNCSMLLRKCLGLCIDSSMDYECTGFGWWRGPWVDVEYLELPGSSRCSKDTFKVISVFGALAWSNVVF